MPIPEFVAALRRHVGTEPLWLIGVTAVVVRVWNGKQEVLLVRRADNGAWAPVTGIVDPDEDIDVAALREVAEETCVEAQVQQLVWVNSTGLVTHVNGDQAYYLDHVLRCRWVSGQAAVGDDESSEVAWWPSHALPAMPEQFAARIACALNAPTSTLIGPAAVPTH